jgi:hypothetical protein
MCPRLSNYQQHESCHTTTTPPSPKRADKTWFKNPGTSHDGYPLYTSATHSIQCRTRSGPTAVPDQQARCNGCILPASTVPLDNVMCQYTALNCTNKVHPLWSLEMAQKCVTHSAERGYAPFTIRVVASRYN